MQQFCAQIQKPLRKMRPAQIIVLVFMAIISSDKHIMGKYVSGKFTRVLIWLTVIVVSLLTVALLVMQILGIG